MTLTDGHKCLIETYEFLMNYAMIHSVKLDDAEPNGTGQTTWKRFRSFLNIQTERTAVSLWWLTETLFFLSFFFNKMQCTTHNNVNFSCTSGLLFMKANLNRSACSN